ncbi:putative glycosyltransferase [compost metagenome]
MYSIYILYTRFFTDLAIPGWTSVILMLTIGGGIQLMLVGVIGLYVGKIFEEVKQRPLYLVRRRLGLEEVDPEWSRR